MSWYLVNTARSRIEREAIESLAASVDWLTPLRWRIDSSVRIIVDVDIVVNGKVYPLSMRYPNHFPHSPPLVLPRDIQVRWSSHQYGSGGELCLEYGADNWHPEITGATMLLSAQKLIEFETSQEITPSQIPNRHSTTLGQETRTSYSRLLITESFLDMASGIAEGEILQAEVVSIYSEAAFTTIPHSVVLADNTTWFAGLPPLKNFGNKRPATIMRWPLDVNLPSIENKVIFQSSVLSQGVTLADEGYLILLYKDEITLFRYFDCDDGVFVSTNIVQPGTASRLDESHGKLAYCSVAIVGCGSLGSKIASMLSRSGVGSFTLIDDDVLLPDNLVRHDLDWREVGMHKVDSLGNKILLTNPTATVAKRKHRLGGQESSGSVESVLDLIAKSDLIIDASAESSVFNYLCAVVGMSKKSMLWAEVFAGGFGGLIARHRHGLEPDPATMRRTIEDWCRERGRPIERAANKYEGGPDLPFIADDADVSAIAAHASRLAIDTMLFSGSSKFPHSVYLIGLERKWIFDQPFETYPLDVGMPPPITHEDSASPTDEIELERLLALFSEYQNENPSKP